MRITVIGCGRWGSFIARYLSLSGHDVTLYGRASSVHMQELLATRRNELMELPPAVALSTDLSCTDQAQIIVISINSQGLDALTRQLAERGLNGKTIVLCMKGIEIATGRRLSQIASENLSKSNRIAVWLGPGHVQSFCAGIPNCMVIDSEDEETKYHLIDAFSGNLIRFYIGNDLIGNEIGAAAKNVIGIAAGMLDGMSLGALKGALMARGAREVARLIRAMGGSELSAYGLCHLGDYEATVFSPYSHNRRFGEALIRGERYDALAEGYYTAAALIRLSDTYQVDLPISRAVYEILYEQKDPKETLNALFSRSLKQEFWVE